MDFVSARPHLRWAAKDGHVGQLEMVSLASVTYVVESELFAETSTDKDAEAESQCLGRTEVDGAGVVISARTTLENLTTSHCLSD